MHPLPSEARTKWGDRVGRRRDILRAASQVIEHEGYSAFQIRAIAARAGVSSATLYSYFATKEEIYAALMVQRFHDLRATLDQLDGESTRTLEVFFDLLMPEIVDLWRNFGQHIQTWQQATDPSPTIRSLVYAFRESTDALVRATRRAAGSEGLELADDDDLLGPFLWSTLYGTATMHVNGMHDILGYAPDSLTRDTARSLARAVTLRASNIAESEHGDVAAREG